ATPATDRAGPERAGLADLGAVEHARAGMDDRPRADLRARADVGPGGDGGGGMDLRALVDQRALLYARFEDQLAEKKRARFGEGNVRLDGDDARRGARHVLLRGLVDDDRSRPRFGKRSS